MVQSNADADAPDLTDDHGAALGPLMPPTTPPVPTFARTLPGIACTVRNASQDAVGLKPTPRDCSSELRRLQ